MFAKSDTGGEICKVFQGSSQMLRNFLQGEARVQHVIKFPDGVERASTPRDVERGAETEME